MTSQLLGKSRERERDNEIPPGIKKDEHFGRNNGCKRALVHPDQNRLMSASQPLCVCRHRSRGSLSPEEGSLSLSLWHMVIHPNPSGCCS